MACHASGHSAAAILPTISPDMLMSPTEFTQSWMKCTFWIYIYKLLYLFIYEFDLSTYFYGGTKQNLFLNAKQNAWDRKQES